MSDRLSDEQVAWWAIGYSRLWGPTMQPHPIGAVPDPDGEVTALAREVQELRAEAQRLTRWKAEATIVLNRWEDAWDAVDQPGRLGDIKSGAMRDALLAERALADQLAEALRYMKPEHRTSWAGATALATWEAARHE